MLSIRTPSPGITIPSPDSSGENHLLSALPLNERQRIVPHLESVRLHKGDIVNECHGRLSHAYFPTSSIISLVHVLEDGASTEFASVGNEGMLGIALFMGGDPMLNEAVVQREGYAYRLPAQFLRHEFARSEEVRRLLLRYTQFLVTQAAQVAVCNRHHTVPQQLCRWLLLNLDRSPGSELQVTHQTIADMLGVRRESISEAASNLRSRWLIECGRGHITVLDRKGLEDAACECYSVMDREYQRLLSSRTTKTVVSFQNRKRILHCAEKRPR